MNSMMAQKNVKLTDVARRLNFSTATVSKALNNHYEIPPDTVKLIKRTAEKMGYIPNILARNLTCPKTNNIGIIVPQVTDIFYGQLVESIYESAYRNNYSAILMVSQDNEVRERKRIEALISMKVDGIIISISKETKEYSIFETIKSRGIPTIFVDRIPEIKGIRKINISNYNYARARTKEAVELGYKYLAYLNFNKNNWENTVIMKVVNKKPDCNENLKRFELLFTSLRTLAESR